MQPKEINVAKIYFRSIVDCTYYSEKLSGQQFMSEDGNRSIARVYYSINTSDSKSGVELIWDGTTNATALFLSGNGFMDFRTDGNSIPNNATTPTGDVLLSTKNFASGDNYTIIVEFR